MPLTEERSGARVGCECSWCREQRLGGAEYAAIRETAEAWARNYLAGAPAREGVGYTSP